MTVLANTPRRAPRSLAAISLAALAAGLMFSPAHAGENAENAKAVTCQPTRVKAITSDSFRSTMSTTFVPIEEAGGKFAIKGSKPSCVLVRFEAYAATNGGTNVMTVSATIDGEAFNSNEVQLTNSPIYFPSAWTFVIPKVAPGKHRIDFHFRTNNAANPVSLNMTNTVIQFGG